MGEYPASRMWIFSVQSWALPSSCTPRASNIEQSGAGIGFQELENLVIGAKAFSLTHSINRNNLVLSDSALDYRRAQFLYY